MNSHSAIIEKLSRTRFSRAWEDGLWGTGKPLRDGTTGYFARGPDDCWSACCATVLQVPISEFPTFRIDRRLIAGESPEQANRWAWHVLERWLADRSLQIRSHETVPVDAERWIGIVPVSGWFQSHCMVMSQGGGVLFDPTREIVESSIAVADEHTSRNHLAVHDRLAWVLQNPDMRLEAVRAMRRWRSDHVKYGFSFANQSHKGDDR